jgi:hypothetical protein
VEIKLLLEQIGKSRPLSFGYSRMVNAGYVGRDQDEVRRHVEELTRKGIPGPERTPTLYPVAPMLATSEEIEVYGHETSGEVEYVLLVQNDHTIYVGLGSDHTDRHLEKTDIPRAKQICPNVMSQKVWPLPEVEKHWDDLVIQSKVFKDGKEIVYQRDRLQVILNPRDLMEFVRSRVRGPLERTVIFSGTVGALTGGFICGERFEAQLVDSNLDRCLELKYNVRPLDYLILK